jgi:DNA-binding transcriptional LysR family regulator
VVLDDRGAFESALAAGGWRRTAGLTVQDAHSALAIVSRSDMAALVPRRMAGAFAQLYALRIFEPPYPSEPMMLESLWRRDLSDNPALDWLRERLRSAASRL